MHLKKSSQLILGLTLIVVMIAAEWGSPIGTYVNAYVPPPRTTTGLKEIVDALTAATPAENQTDTDGDGMYDCVEAVIGTDFNCTDSDFDLLSDSQEIQLDSDPLDQDTNNDGLTDYVEVHNGASMDIDNDNITNVWDYDNDGDGVNDGIDLSPFGKSALSNQYHFDITLEGKPTFITLQFRPRNPQNMKLYYQTYDWPDDNEGSMKDLDRSLEDLKVVPQLNVTVNVKPNQADVADFGILVTDNGMHVPVYPVWENDEVVAMSAQIFYNTSTPVNLSLDAELMWRTLGYHDEYAKSLQASNGKLSSVAADGKVIANASSVTLSEKFQWIEVSENSVALKLKDGPFLSLADNGFIVANGQSAGTKETFKITHPTNTTIALTASNGKIITVDANGYLKASATATNSSTNFLLLDEGALGEWNVLATYKDQISLTGFTVSQTYGATLGLFFSEDKEQTIRANLLMSYLFLRNSTNHLIDLPSILDGYDVNVANEIGVFGTSDEAIIEMSNAMLPIALSTLPENLTVPIIMGVEESSKMAEMTQYTSGVTGGNRYTIDMTTKPMMTTKTLKMNFYETTENTALNVEDTIRNIQNWELSGEAKFNLQSLVLAWNAGEQTITQAGVTDASNAGNPEWFVAFPIAFESMTLLTRGGLGLKAYQALKFLSFKGWNSASIAKMLETGKTGAFTLWAKMCQKLSVAKEGWAGINGLKSFQKTMKYLEVIGILVDIGLSVLTGFLIADQIGGHLGDSMGAAYGITAATYAIIYAAILFAIGEIPYVGWIISLAIVIADICFGLSDKFSNWLMSLFGPKEDAVTQGWLENVETPEITINDKDHNGLDVGDKITVRMNITSKVNVTVGSDYSWAQKSWYRPYITIDAPAGSFSNTTSTGIPASKATRVTGNYKTERYETGASIEPGIGMPNFPVTITLNINYGLYHSWHHWILFVPCYHDDLQSGSTSSPFTTLYYDVLPGSIDDFANWRGVTPNDSDGDGIVNVNETATNKYAFDSDADGLNDKYELGNGLNPNNYDTDHDGLTDGYEIIYGTNATNSDTDDDGLPDYQEISGYLISFNYLGDTSLPFTMRVFSDPRVSDSDSDGINDFDEYKAGLNPRSADTNGDGTSDITNVKLEKTELEFVKQLDFWQNGLWDIATDSNGYVYVFGVANASDGCNCQVWIYDSNLTLVQTWNLSGTLPTGEYRDSIAIDNQNSLIHFSNYYREEVPRDIVDRANIKTFNLNGTQNGTVWASKTDLDYELGLQSLGTDSQGNVYVARTAGWIQNMVYWDPSTAEAFARVYVDVYAPNRTLLRTFGSYGPDIDQFRFILDLAVDSNNNRIYIAEDGQGMSFKGDPEKVDRVAVFNQQGTYLYSINGFANSTYSLAFNNPSGVVVDSEGYIYVVDSGNKVIDKFDKNYVPIVSWNGSGLGLGGYGLTPTHIALGTNDTIYVIQKSTGEGNSLNRVSMFKQKAPQPEIQTPSDIDDDGLLNTEENNGWNTTFTNSTGTFTLHVTSDPMLKDTDGDGLPDKTEYDLKLNPRSPDTDNDGVDDLTEYNWHHSPSMNPAHFDTDGDGLPDATELTYGSDPTMPDTDGDGLNDKQEFQIGTNPNDTDTDDDGLTDYEEVQFGSNPLSPDSDGDFMFDGAEKADGTNPQNGDSDNDTLIDGYEVILNTSPLKADSDGDNLADGYEVSLWLNPLSNDTDSDGITDSAELRSGSNPWTLDSDLDGVPDNGNQAHIIEKTKEIQEMQNDNSTDEPEVTPHPTTTPTPTVQPSTSPSPTIQPTETANQQRTFDTNQLMIAVVLGIIIAVAVSALFLTRRKIKPSSPPNANSANKN